MDASRFKTSRFGLIVRPVGRWTFPSFVPAPMPRHLELTGETVLALSGADAALGRLAGAGRLLPDPHILAAPYIVREALASSRIEGTQASLSELYEAAAAGTAKSSDVQEVRNYIAALEEGLRLLPSLPISGRLVREVHRVLLDGVRGAEKTPGEFRRTPNWIGAPDDRPEHAIFVPPPVEEMHEAIADWERFVNGDHQLPPLVACGLIHYQFETIHPFLDGNGRLGRLLIILYLVEQDRLPEPLLYVSPYFERHRAEYYDRLQAVRERGLIQEWLQYFFRAVAIQATDAVERAERLIDIREHYHAAVSGGRSRVREVIDLLFEQPIVTTKNIAARLQVSQQAALNYVRELEGRGWLQALSRRGQGGRIYWLAREIFDVLNDLDSP